VAAIEEQDPFPPEQKCLATMCNHWNISGIIGIPELAENTYYPAYYQQPTSFSRPTSSFVFRQMQFSMRLNFPSK
jgi:hypothetical protein